MVPASGQTEIGIKDKGAIYELLANGHWPKFWYAGADSQAAEKYIQVCQSLIDLANIERSTLGLRPRDVKIAFDEWNVWDERKGNTKNGLEQWYDYTDMMGFVAWLHVLVRRSKEVALACLAQAVNVVSLYRQLERAARGVRGLVFVD
jgi:alpha-L-arabinofuranosidase